MTYRTNVRESEKNRSKKPLRGLDEKQLEQVTGGLVAPTLANADRGFQPGNQ